MHKPDLSGEWTLNREASQLSPEVAPVVEIGFVRVSRPGVSHARWDGDTLVFSDTTPTPNGAMTIVFRYELHDEGRCLRAAEQLRGAGREMDNVWIFDRARS